MRRATVLHSTDPKILGNTGVPGEDVWILLRRRNKKSSEVDGEGDLGTRGSKKGKNRDKNHILVSVLFHLFFEAQSIVSQAGFKFLIPCIYLSSNGITGMHVRPGFLPALHSLPVYFFEEGQTGLHGITALDLYEPKSDILLCLLGGDWLSKKHCRNLSRGGKAQ